PESDLCPDQPECSSFLTGHRSDPPPVIRNLFPLSVRSRDPTAMLRDWNICIALQDRGAICSRKGKHITAQEYNHPRLAPSCPDSLGVRKFALRVGAK